MMGSTAPPTKKLDGLPKPPKENLCSYFTLGEIIDHIDTIHEDFPEVDIPRLKSHLWDIRNTNVNHEAHLRGFLKVFQKTPVFSDAFNQLDDGMKVQIKVFMAGGSEEVVLAAGGKGNVFHLPPSPPVKHHFREFTEKVEEKAETLSHPEEYSHAANGSNGIIKTHVEKVEEEVQTRLHSEEYSHAANGINGIAKAHVEKVGEKLDKILHGEHAHATNGINGIVKAHVEKVEEKLEKVLHEEHAHATNGNIANGDVVNGGAVNGFKSGLVEKVIQSTAGYPRIYEDKAGTKTMEVGYRVLILLNQNWTGEKATFSRCERLN
jgi:hypothetical protein